MCLYPVIQAQAQDLSEHEAGLRACELCLKDSLTDLKRQQMQSLYVKRGVELAGEYLNGKRYADARAVYSKILPYAMPRDLPRIRARVALAWYQEGHSLIRANRLEQALLCMQSASSIFHDVGQTEYELNALYYEGNLLSILLKTNESAIIFQKADSLALALHKDDLSMEILTSLCNHYDAIGEVDILFDLSDRMDSIYSATQSARARFIYNDYRGDQALNNKQYAMAERWYLKNESLLADLKHTSDYTHFSNLRVLYTKTNEWDKAINYALRGKAHIQQRRTPDEPEYYLVYSDIASVYREKRDSLNCFRYIDSLFLSDLLQIEPKDRARNYTYRALAYSSFGNLRKTLADYQMADNILASKYEAGDEARLLLLPMTAASEVKLKNYKEGERLYQLYADYIKQQKGENSLDYIDALGYRANAEAFAGHLNVACKDYAEAVGRLKENIRKTWPYRTYSNRELFWRKSYEWFVNMTPFALEAGEKQTRFTESCYDGLILTKAFLLESEHSSLELIRRKGTESDRNDYYTIQALQGKIINWEREGNKNDSIIAATNQIRTLESALSSRCKAYGDAVDFMNIGYRQVKEALKEGEVLLDFTDFVSKSRGRIYAAYIVNNHQRYPLLKELFPESAVDSLHVISPYQFYSGECAAAFYKMFWAPLDRYVKEGSTVYYVPTQMLFQIAPESIPMRDGSLLGDHYHFVRLSSARELVRYDSNLTINDSNEADRAVLYGGLQYSLDTTVMAYESGRYEIPRTLLIRGNSAERRNDSVFTFLPGTQKEVSAVGQELSAAGLSVTPYMGKEGTEESFLSLSGRAPRILHVATHGFFYSPYEAQQVNYLQGYTDAMSLSGIVLSGCNAAWRGLELPEGVMDGILTSSLVAQMDLTGVEMAVLSACHTGRGQPTSEGLYGLQRAFKKAGVKTVIMSLWAESDQVAPEFMQEFYSNLVRNGWDKRMAFDRAKDTIRNKYLKSPSYWAGFVMLD